MKKQFIKFSAMALTAAVMALYVSCNKTEDPTLSVSPSADVVFEANGTSNIGSPNYTFLVETNQGPFTVTPSDPWVKVNQTTTGFTLTAAAITTLAGPPDAKVTVTAGKATPVEIGVKQKGAGSFLDVTPAHRTIVFSANGETCTIGTGTDVFDPVQFTVATNGGATWDATRPEGQNWLTVTKTATGFSLSAAAHISLTAKETKVSVSTSGNAADVEIVVKQMPMPAFLTVNEKDQDVDVDFEAAGGTQTFDVLTNYDGGWSVEQPTNASWLTYNKTSDNSFTLTATANIYADVPDVATVTVKAGVATSIKLLVTQKGKADGSTRWAATSKTWVVNSADGQIKQVWTDYIEYDGKGKVAAGTIDNFINAGTDATGEGDYCRHTVTNIVPDSEGYNEKFKGYFYNYFYIKENKEKLCPAPWRVPHEDDFVALDLALEGTGGNYSADGSSTTENKGTEFSKAQVEKYMDWGVQFSGMRNPAAAWSYVQGNAYLGGQDEKLSGMPDNQFSTMKFSFNGENGANGSAQQDGVLIERFVWAVYTKHYTSAITSRGKAHGWSVRCVRDAE